MELALVAFVVGLFGCFSGLVLSATFDAKTAFRHWFVRVMFFLSITWAAISTYSNRHQSLERMAEPAVTALAFFAGAYAMLMLMRHLDKRSRRDRDQVTEPR